MDLNIQKCNVIIDDGGREAAGFKGKTGDCVCRAIAIATERPYPEVYDLINKYGARERITERKRKKSSARDGVFTATTRKVLAELGWEWVPVMKIGTGCTMHLNSTEIPKGRIIAKVSRHLVACIDGVIHDTYDCSRDGSRCVYGYYRKKEVSK